ncbi:MAG: glycosyltransferase family 4 protein [Pseudomonadota bacterium]|nr:glycosyltransferase family 4 protein [Pseudomonadota bacterium]
MTWHVVTTDYPPRDGGVATWAEGVARALHLAGEPVLVHARDGAPADHPVPAVRMCGRSWARWGSWWAAGSVLPRLRAGDRIVAATWPMASRLLGGAARRDVPVFVAWHGSDLTRPPLVDGLDRVRRSAILIPVSAYLGGLLGQPYTVLPAPIDPLTPVPRGDRLLVVARLGPLKGGDRALRLAKRLGRPITLVGEGPAREGLEALAKDLGVDATFTGALPRDQIPWAGTWALALLSRAEASGDLSRSASRSAPTPRGWAVPPGGAGQEGLGLVLLEAAARGIPSIGSRVGGIPEAASVVLDDPEHDPIPPLPGADAVRAALVARHGSGRVVDVLRELARSRPDRVS